MVRSCTGRDGPAEAGHVSGLLQLASSFALGFVDEAWVGHRASVLKHAAGHHNTQNRLWPKLLPFTSGRSRHEIPTPKTPKHSDPPQSPKTPRPPPKTPPPPPPPKPQPRRPPPGALWSGGSWRAAAMTSSGRCRSLWGSIIVNNYDYYHHRCIISLCLFKVGFWGCSFVFQFSSFFFRVKG